MLKKAIVFSLFLFFLACSPAVNKDKFIVAGTYLEVQSTNKRTAKIVYQEFRRLDVIFNSYDQGSEVSKVNQNPHQEIKVSSDLIEIVQEAKDYYQFTEGAFDIAKGKLYNFWKKWGETSKTHKLPEITKIEKLKNLGNIKDIEINQANKTIKLKDKEIVLDLSGIAKGYMVDKAVERLKEAGIKSTLINAGGETYCLGKNNEKPWRVGIKGPGGIIKIIEVVDAAVATSGNYEQVYKRDGKIYSHIINPQTGYPVVKNFLGVTVIAKKCREADILATVFFIKGKKFAEKIIQQKPSLEVYFVTEKGVEKIN